MNDTAPVPQTLSVSSTGDLPEECLELFRRNSERLLQFFPQLFKILSDHTPSSELVKLDNGEFDIKLQGMHLYDKKGGESWTQDHLAEYWKKTTSL
jgi:hypothetical protein